MSTRFIKDSEEDSFESYIKELFKTGDDAEIFSAITNLDVPMPYSVRIKILYSSMTPAFVISGLVQAGLVHRINNKAKTYIYETSAGHRLYKEIQVPFFIVSFDAKTISASIQAIIAICKGDQWKVFKKFLAKNYPALVPVLLSQSELVSGAKALKTLTGHEVYVKAISAKESLRGATGSIRKSVREWTDEDLEAALLTIHDRSQIVDSLDLEFIPMIGTVQHVMPKATCKIRKDSEIEVSGSFNLVFDAVAMRIAQIGENKLKFYSGRGLRENEYKPRSLAINFSEPIFNNTESLGNLMGILQRYPHSMHAIMQDIPYSKIKIADLHDGSSFDVWGIPPARIVLIPGLKTSEAAFERLIHFIFDAFKEGQIVNHGTQS